MAKEKEKKSEQKAPEVKMNILSADAETIEKNLDKLTTTTDDITQKALAELDEEKDKRIKEELKERIGRASYEHLKSVLSLKRQRKMDDVAKERMHRSEGLLCQLTGQPVEHKDTIIDGKTVEVGFTVKKEDRLSYVTYDEKVEEMNRDIAKMEQEVSKWYATEEKKLRQSFIARYGYARWW